MSRAASVFRAASLVARNAPGPVVNGLARVLGQSVALAPSDRRLLVERNMRRADPSLSGRRLRATVHRCFESYARYWAESFRLRLEAGRVTRDPEGPWDSAGAYAVRAGLLCELAPGPASLVGRVLGPLLDRGRLAGLPFQGPMEDAGTLHRLLGVSAGLLSARWPYPLPPGRLTRGVGNGPVFLAPARW